MDEAERAARFRRSVDEDVCAWRGTLIDGRPAKRGFGDSELGRFCSMTCEGNTHGSEFVARHSQRLRRSDN
jgi:hypothetical protein